jgi:hypothetical protein
LTYLALAVGILVLLNVLIVVLMLRFGTHGDDHDDGPGTR